MRLSRTASVARRRKDKELVNIRAKKKHKRLDAICEETYKQNHNGVGTSEWNGDESEVELRRGTRVRKAPVLLDASPPPPKKRRKIDKRSGMSGVERKVESPCSTSKGLEEESCSAWQSRLRCRTKGAGNRVRNNVKSSPAGKKKLFFKDVDGPKEETELDIQEAHECEKSTIVKSKRPGRVKASNIMVTEHQESDTGGGGVEDDKMIDQDELLQMRDEIDDGISKTGFKEGVDDDNALSVLVNKDMSQSETCVVPEECHTTDKVGPLEQDLQGKNEESVEVNDQKDALEGGLLADDEKDGATEKQAKDGVDTVDDAHEKEKKACQIAEMQRGSM